MDHPRLADRQPVHRPAGAPARPSHPSHFAGWIRGAYWLVFSLFFLLMLVFVWQTLEKPFTPLALLTVALLILTPADHRFALLTFAAGSGLGYFLEVRGTTRACWTLHPPNPAALRRPGPRPGLGHLLAPGMIIKRCYPEPQSSLRENQGKWGVGWAGAACPTNTPPPYPAVRHRWVRKTRRTRRSTKNGKKQYRAVNAAQNRSTQATSNGPRISVLVFPKGVPYEAIRPRKDLSVWRAYRLAGGYRRITPTWRRAMP